MKNSFSSTFSTPEVKVLKIGLLLSTDSFNVQVKYFECTLEDLLIKPISSISGSNAFTVRYRFTTKSKK